MSNQRIAMSAIHAVIGSSLLTLSCAAGGAETFAEALRESEPLLNLRLRYEGVDQEGIAEEADPLTARLRFGIQSGEWSNTTLLAEAVGLADVSGDYNDTLNGQTQYPVVADPGDIATINRFAITNKSLENTALTFGRQRIILDDARFVGNVGWRQLEQTYDGLRAVIGGDDKVKVDLSYVSQVNRIFGPESPNGKFNGDIVLANVSKSFGPGSLTGFAYSLDLDEAATLSTNTVGLRFIGSRQFDAIKVNYLVWAAQQTDTGDNTRDLSELYLKLEGGLGFGKATVSLGAEQLGGDGSASVTMPLSTLHAFNGWADLFLATPLNGLNDKYARFDWQAGGVGPFSAVNFTTRYHEYESDFGSISYGDEINFQLTARVDRMLFLVKYATYDADQLGTDRDKLWMSVDYAF